MRGELTQAAKGAGHQLYPRHPRPGRSAGAGRRDRRDEQRRDRTGRPRARCVQRAAEPNSWRSSWAGTTSSRCPKGISRSAPMPSVTDATERRVSRRNVTAVEYQGTHVSLLSRITGDQEVTALIPDSRVLRQPASPRRPDRSALGRQQPTPTDRINAALHPPDKETTNDQIYKTQRPQPPHAAERRGVDSDCRRHRPSARR